MTRRDWLGGVASFAVAQTRGSPAAPVAVGPCNSYDHALLAPALSKMLDRLGGLGGLVKGKTVTVKLNLTGPPGWRLAGKPPGDTHHAHPKLVESFVHLLGQAGAKRIRLVESCWGTGGPMEEFLLDCGWPVRRLLSAYPGLELENTNALGKGKRYARLSVRAPYVYPGFDVNRGYAENDVFVTLAKLKNHATCGVALSLNNSFGITPASIYGDDAGYNEPNEQPMKGRAAVLHHGLRPPSKSAPQEVDPGSTRAPGYRVPRIVADLAAARPIDLAVVDGIETMAGGEGPWIRGTRPVRPGVLIAGTNPVCTDAVAMAVMGYDPAADFGTPPFDNCDNALRLAEARGIGTTDLKRIEVRGIPLRQALFRFQA